jgi:hypothetical protein
MFRQTSNLPQIRDFMRIRSAVLELLYDRQKDIVKIIDAFFSALHCERAEMTIAQIQTITSLHLI